MKHKPVQLILALVVYVLLMTFCHLPTPLSHTSILPSLAFLSLVSAMFGPWWAGLIGLVGHLLSDYWQGGEVWVSWAIGSGLSGILYGIGLHRIRQARPLVWKDYLQKFQIIQVVGNFIIFGLLAPTLDVVFYHASSAPAFQQGWLAALVNSLTLASLGTLLLSLWFRWTKNHKAKQYR